jgi:hypothetical protein
MLPPTQEANHKAIHRKRWRRFVLVAASPFAVLTAFLLFIRLSPGVRFDWTVEYRNQRIGVYSDYDGDVVDRDYWRALAVVAGNSFQLEWVWYPAASLQDPPRYPETRKFAWIHGATRDDLWITIRHP